MITSENEKIIGPLKIIDTYSISINNQAIALADIVKFKRKTETGSIVSSLFYVIVVLSGIAIIADIADDSDVFDGVLAIAGLIVGGAATGSAILTNDWPQNNPNSKWYYEIIMNMGNSR